MSLLWQKIRINPIHKSEKDTILALLSLSLSLLLLRSLSTCVWDHPYHTSLTFFLFSFFPRDDRPVSHVLIQQQPSPVSSSVILCSRESVSSGGQSSSQSQQRTSQRPQHDVRRIAPTVRGVAESARLLSCGRVVAIPTETVYLSCTSVNLRDDDEEHSGRVCRERKFRISTIFPLALPRRFSVLGRFKRPHWSYRPFG